MHCRSPLGNALVGLVAVLSMALVSVEGHTLVIGGRGNLEYWGTCGAGTGCKGPCDSPKAAVPPAQLPVVQRGQVHPVKWNRMNRKWRVIAPRHLTSF